jgi:hypothetical protein
MSSKTEGGTGRARRKAARPISESSAEVFEYSKPEPIERLARIEGQTNFWSILPGQTEGPDTSPDMASISLARKWCAFPEILEVFVAQSDRFKIPLMSLVFEAIRERFRPKKKDLPWIRGTVADAYLLLRYGRCKPYEDRAKQFKVDVSAYSAMRKVSTSIVWLMLDEADKAWTRARHAKG